jgi:CHAT domain-containing protein
MQAWKRRLSRANRYRTRIYWAAFVLTGDPGDGPTSQPN